jgi:hypothetical protein
MMVVQWAFAVYQTIALVLSCEVFLTHLTQTLRNPRWPWMIPWAEPWRAHMTHHFELSRIMAQAHSVFSSAVDVGGHPDCS